MKKKIFLLILLSAFLTLCLFAGCSEKTGQPEEPTPVETPEVTAPVETQMPEEPVKEVAQTLTLSKFFAQQWEWDDEILLALNEYNTVTLLGDDTQKFPALAETLEQRKTWRYVPWKTSSTIFLLLQKRTWIFLVRTAL